MIEKTKEILLAVFIGSVLGLAIFTFQPVYYKQVFIILPPPSLSKSDTFVEDVFTTVERIKSFTFRRQIDLGHPGKGLKFMMSDSAFYLKPTRNNDAIYVEIKSSDKQAISYSADAIVQNLNSQFKPKFDGYKVKLNEQIASFGIFNYANSKDRINAVTAVLDLKFTESNLKYTLAFEPLVKEIRYIEYLWEGMCIGVLVVTLMLKLFLKNLPKLL